MGDQLGRTECVSIALAAFVVGVELRYFQRESVQQERTDVPEAVNSRF